MRAVQIQRFGLEGLVRVELPEPEPGPGQVLVQVRACSLNYRDLLTVLGQYNPRQPLPLVPLSDGVGEVIGLGAGVDRVRLGDRVAGIFAQRWLAGSFDPAARSSTLGGPLDGMLAERVVLHQDGLVQVPGHLSDEQAACLPCAGVTAYNALFEQGGLRAGQTVLLLGTGGVSILALQLAKAAGARCILTSSSDEKLERARALGADRTINYRTQPDWDRQVRDWTGGTGVDVVVEVGGAGTLARSIAAARFEGRVCLIGVLAGVVAELPVTAILMKQVRVCGVLVGSRAMFYDLNRLVAVHRLEPVVDRVYAFEQAAEALAQMQAAGHFGKLVIRVG
jgi:NADPH:quinone reductase-like Zn-dependent oxidoreductase